MSSLSESWGRRELLAAGLPQLRDPFRGEIWEFFKDVPMGRGFENKGKPFDIITANYLREPMREIRRQPCGKFVACAAVQMLKTMGMVEQPAAYFTINAPGDMAIFLTGDQTALDQAKARSMPYFKSQKEIAEALDTVVKSSITGRFDITMQEFYLPGMVLRMWPLNLSTTQRMTLRYVFISDAFLSQRTGLIKEAIARTTQHNTSTLKDYKIIIESQGGEEDDDFDAEWKNTDQRILNIRCHYCGCQQPFDWHTIRPSDFIATPTLDIPSLDHADWVRHFTPILKSDDRRHAGFKRGDDAVIKLEGENYNEKEVLKQTYFECYHCGSAIKDTPDNRLKLDESTIYIPSNPNAIAEHMGWWWPAWAGQRIPWGKIMLEFLGAVQSQKSGNLFPLKQWNQKRAAKTWNPKQGDYRKIEISTGSYETDPSKLGYPLETYHCRQMTVDCGKDVDAKAGEKIIGKLFFEVRDWEKTGNCKQLARGMVESVSGSYSAWDLLAAQQRYWKVPCRRVLVDAAWMPSQVMEAAAKHFELVPPDKPFQLPSTWRLLWGADGKRIGNKGQTFVEEKIPGVWRAHDKNGKLWAMSLQKIRWLNYWFEDQLVRILLGTATVKWENLTQDKLIIVDIDGKPSSELSGRYCEFEKDRPNKFQSWNSGLDSRHLDMEKNKYLDTYKQGHWTEPRDLALMQLVGVAADGILGHVPTEAAVV